MENQEGLERTKELVLSLSNKDYARLLWLKAWLSREKKRSFTLAETISYLLDRHEKWKKIRLWAFTGAIFLAITSLLLLPFGVRFTTFLILACIGAIFGLVSFYLAKPGAFRKASLLEDVKLIRIINDLSRRADLRSTPRILILDTPELNALAVEGRAPCVVLTKGLYDAYTAGHFNDDEMAAILGHELGHIKNRDGLRSTIASAWISIFAIGGELVTHFGMRLIHEARHEREDMVWIVLFTGGLILVLFGVYGKFLAKVASVIYFYFSRTQEYDADNIGSQLSHPRAMASALKKLEEFNVRVQQELQQLPFPDQWQVKPRKLSWIDRLWTTHPPTEMRVRRQEELAQFIMT